MISGIKAVLINGDVSAGGGERCSPVMIVNQKQGLAMPSATETNKTPLVGIIMGSVSDWETMQGAAGVLDELSVPYEAEVVSAHRTPDKLFGYAEAACGRGIEVIVAGAGGAAHLPGMTAAKTALPVIGVPIRSKALSGMDSLLSIVQMPAGIPVATMSIGRPGAVNAGLFAAAILGLKYPEIREALEEYRRKQTEKVLASPDPAVAGAAHHSNVLGFV